jgi:hypothetical protein
MCYRYTNHLHMDEETELRNMDFEMWTEFNWTSVAGIASNPVVSLNSIARE